MLKGELGFDGLVISDWAGIDQVDPDYYQAVVKSINAGIDMNMVALDYVRFITTMKRAVKKGDISMERIDDAVRRILLKKFELGLFDHPFRRCSHAGKRGLCGAPRGGTPGGERIAGAAQE